MHFGSPIAKKKARLEIIPLIDVMFFLLAAFMMVSLTMQKIQTVRMDLPSAVQASSSQKPDIVNVDISSAGDLTVDRKRVTLPDLETLVTDRMKANTNLPVYIRADPQTKHGRVLEVLDSMKAVKVPKVSWAIDPPKGGA
ncbi:MAG TPA: biopolymer transporter ExbD [Verrucomicrobiota bacterium]|nr:biopolymer transporter ExbD [Verrucomicrobiales bacterium]HRI12648.1 biopolymer transporter ExbD [Verrucomicrobiota bacterium]